MSAPELILHHYPGSPFAEKARLMLGFKNLPWRGVQVPVIMPKPDLVALTGGYRRTPVLQVGADVYCDTALIARVLEARASVPSLYPATAPLATMLAQWADSTLFWTVIPYTMQPMGLAHIFQGVPAEALKAFAADRAPFTASLKRQTVADATANLHGYLRALDQQLADGRPWLLGEQASIADFAVAHCGWYVRRGGPVAEVLAAYTHFNAWLDRTLAIGHGSHTRMDAAEALAIAAAASAAGQHAPVQVQAAMGFEPGAAVTVTPTDYGMDPVAGALVGLTPDTVTLRRADERAGTVHVHFPRAGFQIRHDSAQQEKA